MTAGNGQAPTATAAPQAPAAPTISFTDERLGNGLRLIMSPDPLAPVAAVNIWDNAGSTQRPAGQRAPPNTPPRPPPPRRARHNPVHPRPPPRGPGPARAGAPLRAHDVPGLPQRRQGRALPAHRWRRKCSALPTLREPW